MTEENKKVEAIRQLVLDVLEDNKAQKIECIDVRGKTSVADYMVVATGTSGRHVKALAEHVAVEAKKKGIEPLGTEGQEVSDWVLVDLGDVIAHVMQEKTREYYQLEKLWQPDFSEEVAAQAL